MSNKITLSKEDYNSIIFDDYTEKYEIVKSGAWVSCGKWETKEVIFRDLETNKTYKTECSRTGSYYTDYYYENDYEAVEVEEVEVVKKVWRIKDVG